MLIREILHQQGPAQKQQVASQTMSQSNQPRKWHVSACQHTQHVLMNTKRLHQSRDDMNKEVKIVESCSKAASPQGSSSTHHSRGQSVTRAVQKAHYF